MERKETPGGGQGGSLYAGVKGLVIKEDGMHSLDLLGGEEPKEEPGRRRHERTCDEKIRAGRTSQKRRRGSPSEARVTRTKRRIRQKGGGKPREYRRRDGGMFGAN